MNNWHNKSGPPKLANRILRWFCSENLLEEYDKDSVDVPTTFWADKLVKKSEVAAVENGGPCAGTVLLRTPMIDKTTQHRSAFQ